MTRSLLWACGGVPAAGVLVAGALLAGSLDAQEPDRTCSAAALQLRAPGGTTIASARLIDASDATPRHCLVHAVVDTPGNAVNVRLGLPAAWNGKFYFEGVGGFGGAPGSIENGLVRGYASASTDTGHQGIVTDASWAAGNPAKVLDFAHRGTHAATVAAKAMTGGYFGTPPRYSYFNGCSNGGRQGLMEAQRYPDDFDGIIAGNPSFGTLGQIQRALIFQTMLASPERVLPASKVTLLARASLASCDGADGLQDGLISDPRACRFRPETLACSDASGDDCLTAGEIETVQAIYADVTAPNGVVLHGFPPGHEDGRSGWQQWLTGVTPPTTQADGTLTFGANPPLGFRFADGFLRYLAFPGEPPFDWRTFSFDREASRMAAAIEPFSPTNPDLTSFVARGGRLILYHGWADPGLSAATTVAYHEEVRRTTHDADAAVRLFMAPGMHHCQGNGPGPNTFDMLSALEAWVERGTPPVRVIASHASDGRVDRTRPLCAYPQVARYVGSGSIDAAENFRCEAP
jgi:feruloyl esterase